MSKLVKGDKIKLVKPMGVMTNIGEVCEVIDVDLDNGFVSFLFGNGLHYGCMSFDEYERHFTKVEKVEESTDNNKVEEMDMDDFKLYLEHEDKDIERAFKDAKVCLYTAFDKCTIVAVRLHNGFVITESSACVNPEDYDEKLGIELCMKKIVERVYEMVAYEKHTRKKSEEKLRQVLDKADILNKAMPNIMKDNYFEKYVKEKDFNNKDFNKVDKLNECDGDCEHCPENSSKDDDYDNSFLKFLDDIILGSH